MIKFKKIVINIDDVMKFENKIIIFFEEIEHRKII